MSKEEFLKIQLTCVLKVNIHCDGCKQKVKKILQKIEGVYTIKIDSEQGKVTVSGNVNGATLIKKLTKNGKHAEIWGAPKTNNNNHFKNLQIENGKGGKHQQQQPQLQKGGAANQPKGGGFPHGIHPQMKGFQDLKLPPLNNNPNQKMMKVNLPEDEGLSDDDYDDEFDDDDDYTDEEDDDFEDELDDGPPMNKMKPMMGNGNGGMPNMMIAQQAQQMMKAAAAANGGGNGGNGGGNGKKGGGGGNIPTQMMNLGGGGGKKGGNGNNNSGNQSQGGSGGGGGKGGKNGGGQPQLGGGNGGGGAGHINNFIAHGPKKGGGMNDGPYGMLPNMMSMNAAAPSGPHIPNLPMTQMTNLAAVQGLPAMNAGAGAGGPEHMAGNPFLQQQMAAMMMNQQSPVAAGGGNERFQHMMYARPPPAVNYMPAPYPPYPYPPPPGERADQYSMFSDENTTSCTVM